MTHYGNAIADYQNGNYRVVLLNDGTKIRETEEEFFEPEFPENIDVKITDRCDGGCPFCYEGCTIQGKHAKLFDGNGKPLQNWLANLHPGTEIALNGNDLTHPELDNLLSFLKERGVIANLTVNQKHFLKHYERLKAWSDNKLIWGLGISLDQADKSLKKVVEFPNAVLHTIVGLLNENTIRHLRKYGGPNLKVLLLGYKEKERGVDFKNRFSTELKDNTENLKKLLPVMQYMFKAVSFDCLALEQLDVKNILFKGREELWNEGYQGTDSTTTFYIDAVEGLFARDSSVSQRLFNIESKTADQMLKQLHEIYGTGKF